MLKLVKCYNNPAIVIRRSKMTAVAKTNKSLAKEIATSLKEAEQIQQEIQQEFGEDTKGRLFII